MSQSVDNFIAVILNSAKEFMCDGAGAYYLLNSAIFCHPAIGLFVTSALAAYMIYLFASPPVYTSSSP